MSVLFIDVEKVSKETKKTEDGSKVTNPHSRGRVESNIVVQLETIRADKIKSARPWRKSAEEEMSVEGDMTILYFEGDYSRSTTPDMKINESHDSFSRRLKSIEIGQE